MFTIKREANEREAAEGMDRIAKGLFKPIYPVIAENAVDETGIREGVCLDAGSGPASLAIAMAEYPFRIFALDHSPVSNEIAEKNIGEVALSGRINVIEGAVEEIPLESGTVDLVVSRGSIFFWEDHGKAFSEIERVLKPGGKTYIGGGFGNAILRDSIVSEMIRKNPEWEERYIKNTSGEMRQKFRNAVSKLKECSVRYIDDDTGFWIVLEKKVSAQ